MVAKHTVVIPMAGAGSRFKKAGYKEPKPFIEVNGSMMIEHVLNSFLGIASRFVLVVRSEFLIEQKNQLDYLERNYPIDFVAVPKLTMGAAITGLAAHRMVDPSNDVIFADSDNIFIPEDIANFISYVDRNKLDGALLTQSSDNPCFSYAKVDDSGLLVETREKEVISSHAICGVYYFKSVDLFRNAVIDLVVESDLEKGEFYMSSVFNHLLKFTKDIGVFDINNFYCVGTPEQLKQYLGKNNEVL